MEIARRRVLTSLLGLPAAAAAAVAKQDQKSKQLFLVGYAPPVAGFDDNDQPVPGVKLLVEAINKVRPGGMICLPSVFDGNNNRLFDVKAVHCDGTMVPGELRTIDGKECVVIELDKLG